VCADQLSSGEVDVGLIPSIEYQRIPDLQVIPDISIAALGKVRSILLVRPKDAGRIDTVSLDTSSRTSVALARILLHRKMGVYPKFIEHPPVLSAMLERSDAALLIGDAALQVQMENYLTNDLALEWSEWQRKPFVFAFWACRTRAGLSADLASIFMEAKEWGLKRRGEIASVYARSLNLPESFLESYLMENIDFELTPRHLEGLETFYQLAGEENLILSRRSLQLYGPPSSSTLQ
jgi:chorismate dehydratase